MGIISFFIKKTILLSLETVHIVNTWPTPKRICTFVIPARPLQNRDILFKLFFFRFLLLLLGIWSELSAFHHLHYTFVIYMQPDGSKCASQTLIMWISSNNIDCPLINVLVMLKYGLHHSCCSLSIKSIFSILTHSFICVSKV